MVQQAREAAAFTTTHHKVEKSVKRKHECFRCGGAPSASARGGASGSVSRRKTQAGQAHFYAFICDKTSVQATQLSSRLALLLARSTPPPHSIALKPPARLHTGAGRGGAVKGHPSALHDHMPKLLCFFFFFQDERQLWR